MTDSTNNSFEHQWQKAFDDAELTPPESVWEKIELGLTPENTPPSKPNFGNKPYYFLGGIIVGLLGLFLWLNNTEKENQVVEKEVVKSNKIIALVGEDTNHGAGNKPNTPLSVSSQTTTNMTTKSSVWTQTTAPVVGVHTNHRAEEKIVEVVGEDTNHGTETTTIEKTLTDSVEMIEPLTIKNIHSNIETPIINLPTDQTPYYVKPSIKPQKKSIFKNVKISVGAGAYQR